MYVKCLGKIKHFMLHLRQPKGSGMISSCSSGEGLCVIEQQLLSHLAHIMVSLELHFSYNSILNDINNINVFLRAIEALAELLKQESFTFPKIWEEITGNA